MSQVNFFMTAEDEANFLDFLFSRTDTHVLNGVFFESHNPTPLGYKEEVDRVAELTLVNKEIMPQPVVGRRYSNTRYSFEMFYDPTIEVSRSRLSKGRLLNGRIYAKIGWLKAKEANAVYKSWYGSIERWLKKRYHRVNKIWWFGAGAWEWSMAGGVCCFGGELAFTTSLAMAERDWIEN